MSRLNELRNSLNDLCDYLDETYYINFGGCCFLASIIAQYLDKLDITYDLLIFDAENKNNSSITYEVSNMYKMKGNHNSVSGDYTCTHYCLSIPKCGIINGASYNADKDLNRYKISSISSKNIKWIYKNSYWNDVYDIKNNRKIKRIIRSFFIKHKIS